MRKELFEGLSDEQMNKVINCKSAEDVLALAKAEGVELNDEQLEAVSGGCGSGGKKCPKCGSSNFEVISSNAIHHSGNGGTNEILNTYRCLDCNHKWSDK